MKKKLIAGMTSTALIASIGAPAFAAFNDVPAGHWAAGYINKLVAAGVINGVDANNFAPEGTLTRAQFAKFVTVGLGLDTTSTTSSFSDVSGWAVGYVEAAKKAGIINGEDATHFNPEGLVTREQAAAMMVRALRTVGELQPGTALNFPDADQVSSWFKSDIEVAVTNGLLNGKDGKLAPQGSATRAEAAALTDRLMGKADELKNADPKVLNVSAVNSKQIKVQFNKEIKSSTVISNTTTGALVANTVSVSRTTQDGTNPNKNVSSVIGSLSDDGKTLTLTADTTEFFDGTYAVTVSDTVKTTADKAIAPFAGTVTVSDKAVPTVSSVVFNPTTGNLEVTVSEPVSAVPDVLRVNGTPVTGLAAASAKASNTKFTVAKPASVAAGSTATVHVDGAADYNGNILVPFDANVAITNDQSELQVVSASQVSSNVAKIVLNKSIATNNAGLDAAISALIDGQSVAAADVTFAKDANDTEGKTILATFANTYTAPNYFYGSASSKNVTFVFAHEQVADVFGKKLATTTQTVNMTKDVTGPKAVSAKVSTDGKYIDVTFDEVITNLVPGTSNANITLRKDGVDVAMSGANADAQIIADENGDDKVLRVTPDDQAQLAAGTYTVRLAAATVEDSHTNDNDVVSVNASVSSTTSNLTAAIANLGGANNQFQVTYSEAVGSSALERTNYTLDGRVLPEGTDIYFTSSAKTVVNIVLPANSVNVGPAAGTGTANNARLAVSNVTASSGKVVVSNSATVKVQDNTAATLQSATLVGNNIVKLTFNEDLTNFSSSTISDIIDEVVISAGSTNFAATALSPGVNAATATASVSGKDLIITVTPGDSNWSAVTTASTVTVKTAAGDGDVKDANGVAVKADVSVTLQK